MYCSSALAFTPALRMLGRAGVDAVGDAGLCRLLGDLLLEQRPVEGEVVLVIEGAEQDAEELPQVHVVRVLIEAQATGVVEVHGKLCWESLQTDD